MTQSPSLWKVALLVTALPWVVSGCGRSKEAAPAESPSQAPSASAQAPAASEATPGYPGAQPQSEGYATPPPAAPAPPAERAPASSTASREELAKEKEPETLAEAEAALAKAREDLRLAWAEPSRGRSQGAGAQPRAADEGEAKAAKAESRCGSACRAFASLGRAAGAVCRLAGESTERCTRAKHVVAESEQRVSVCGCGQR
jgi:cytoskeletal protein RodZ